MPDLLLGLFIGHRLSRWSSSGQDKAIYGSEFAGRLDFNQPTEVTTRSDALLEVPRPSGRDLTVLSAQEL